MKNKIKLSFGISNFEPISETSESKLIGGFSKSQSSSMGFDYEINGNNCMGSNCASNCDGSGVQNTKCNTVTNCGVIISN
ncbi:hypothetical protein [Lacinutrix chionoecetis]